MTVIYSLVLPLMFSTAIISSPIYSDLTSYYEDSKELNVESEAKWLLLAKAQSLISLILKNAGHLCSLDSSASLELTTSEQILRRTITEIYEYELSVELEQAVIFGNEMELFLGQISSCLLSNNSMIPRFINQLMNRTFSDYGRIRPIRDTDDMIQARYCVQSVLRTDLYPESILFKVIDSFWKGFLIVYFGCNAFWKPYVNAWQYFDTVYRSIIIPLLKHWQSSFFKKNFKEFFDKENDTNTTKGLYLSNIQNSKSSHSIPNSLSTTLEICSMVLYKKHPVNPIPCINDKSKE